MITNDTVLRLREAYFPAIDKVRQNLGPGLRDGCRQDLLSREKIEYPKYGELQIPYRKDEYYFEYNHGGNKIDIPINIDKCIRYAGRGWKNEVDIKKNAEAIKKDAEDIVLSLESQADQVVIDAMAKMFVIALDGSSLKQTSAHPTGRRSHMIVTDVGNTREYRLTEHHLKKGLSKLKQSGYDIKNAQLLVTPNIEAQLRLDSVFEEHTCSANISIGFIGTYDDIKVFTIPGDLHQYFGLPWNQPIPSIKGKRALCFLYIPETIGYASSGESSGRFGVSAGSWENSSSDCIIIDSRVGSVVIDPTGIVGILCNNNIDMGKREDPIQQ